MRAFTISYFCMEETPPRASVSNYGPRFVSIVAVIVVFVERRSKTELTPIAWRVVGRALRYPSQAVFFHELWRPGTSPEPARNGVPSDRIRPGIRWLRGSGVCTWRGPGLEAPRLLSLRSC